MRVAVITADWPAFSGGGVAALTRSMARGLVQAGAVVEVWTRGGSSRSRSLDAAGDESFAVIGLSGRSWRRRGSRHWSRGLPPLLERFAPDRVIAANLDVVAAGWPVLGSLPGLAVFAHGRDITADRTDVRQAERERVLRGGHRWMCLTEWMRGQLQQQGVPPADIHRVPAAVEAGTGVSARQVRPEGPVEALCVGRLVARKGQDVAIEAVRRLRSAVRLRIVGVGPDRARLERLAAGADNIRIEGHLTDARLEQAWASADVFLMPAREEPGGDTEGYGLVFLEAGARGLPAVGGRTAGVAEAIDHRETGLLVDDPRDPAAVAETLRELVRSPTLRFDLGAEGRRRWERSGTPAHLGRAVLEGWA